MKKNIPLFYSILISLIVLIGGSFANYQILQEKKLAIKEEVQTRTKSIFYALEDSIKNEDLQAIDSKMKSLKNETRQSKDLLRVSVILLPQFYYYSSTQTKLVGTNVPNNLKKLFQNSQNSNTTQRISNEDGSEVTFQSVINTKSVLNNQTWVINTVFSVAPFDKKLADLQFMLILIQIVILATTFSAVYVLCSILSRNLHLLSYALGNILNNKSEIKLANSFVEISKVREKLERITRIFTQQKTTIQKLEAEIQNPLKQGSIESNTLEKQNYLCILMRIDYLAFKNTDTVLNLKDFLLDIFYLIVKHTQEVRVKILQFSNQFLLVLDSESSFSKALQAIKTIQKKIQTSSSTYKKFGVADCNIYLAAHYGSVKISSFGEQNTQYELTYGDAINILNSILAKTQSGEILITESVFSELEGEKKKEFLDINLDVSFLGKMYKLLLWGKRKPNTDIVKTEKYAEREKEAIKETKKDLSIGNMLEETLTR